MSMKISRRNFLKCAGAATLAVAASGVLTSCGKPEDIVMQDVTVYFVYQTVRQNTTATVSVPKNADVLSTALIKPEQLPEGFKIAKQGEVPITVVDGVATAEVEIVVGTPNKVVEVRFFEEEGGSQLPETTTVEVEATAQVVNVADIKIPEKYKSRYDTVNGQPAIGTDRDGKLYTVVILRAKEISFTIQYVLDEVVLSGTHTALSTIKSVSEKELNPQQVNELKNKGYEPNGDGTVGDNDVITVPVKKIMGNVTVTYKTKKFNILVETKKKPLQLWIKDTKVTGETLEEQAPLSTINSWTYTIDEGPFDVIWTGNSGVVNATVSSKI